MDSEAGKWALWIGLAIGAIVWNFLPTAIAVLRKHHNAMPIFLVNLFLGWTCIGWLVALIWSFSAVDERLRRF